MAEPENSSTKSKKIIERSASYPSVTISETINLVSTVSKNFTPQHVITREDISAVTKIKTVHRITASAVQYGLFLRVKEGYKISKSFKDYVNPVSPEEKRKLLLSFFTSPKLYNELIEAYNDHAIPPELKSILIRNHKIAENAAAEVAEIFLENARFVGVVSDSGVLNLSNNEINANGEEKQSKQDAPLKTQDSPAIDNVLRMMDQNHGQEEMKVVLTESKYCFIKYPKNLNEKDILILKKWIELLELTL